MVIIIMCEIHLVVITTFQKSVMANIYSFRVMYLIELMRSV